MDLGLASTTRSRVPSIPTWAFRRLRRAAALGVENVLGGLALSELQYRLDARRGRQRPPGYDADYWRWFPGDSRVFLGYLKRWKALPVANGHRGPAAVVIMPWVETPTPWYSIMIAIGLVRRGRNVVLIWDDTGFPQRGLTTQNRAIGRVLAYVGRALRRFVRVRSPPSQRGRPTFGSSRRSRTRTSHGSVAAPSAASSTSRCSGT